MEGMWFKHCPRCLNYLKKSDPQESAMCCACGWAEYERTFYCEILNQFCANTAETKIEQLPRVAANYLPLDGK